MGNVSPCPYHKWLSPFLDNALSERRQKQMRQHLETCDACQTALDDFMELDSLLGDIPDIEPSADFDQRFWEKLAEQTETTSAMARLYGYLISGWRPLALVAALMVAIWGGILLQRHYSRMSVDQIVIAQQLDLLKDYDLITQLDMLENWEAIRTMGPES